MISNVDEYRIVQEQIRSLEDRLVRLQQRHPLGSNGYTKAGVRRMIARLQQELAVFEVEAGKTPSTATQPVSVEDSE
jgi:hypothetical protein